MTSPGRKYYESVIKSLLRTVHQQNVTFISPRNSYYIVKQQGVKITYLLTYVVTYSMEYSHSWEANRFPASQEISRISWAQKSITVLIRARKDEDYFRKLPVLRKIWSCSIALHDMWHNLLYYRKLLCTLNHSGSKTNCKTRWTQSTLIQKTWFHWCLYEYK
jgi:hypothetical protein